MIYVLYHSKCYDGFAAAFTAWKKFGDNAAYIPVTYGSPPPELLSPTEIYIVDFSYPPETLLLMAESAQVVVLDHHKTAEEALRPLVGLKNPEVHFDMSRSGALMAWEYFHAGFAVETPRLIKYISDRDLWEFKLADSAAVHKALVSYPMDFRLWDSFDCDELIREGATCERLYNQLVQNIIESAWFGKVAGHTVPMVNTSIAWSEVGDALLKKYPNYDFVASFTVFDSQVMWSLRSRPEFDVSEVAKRFGGGGHKNAAGFKSVKV